MHNDIKKILVTEENINEICERLGKQISKDYESKEPLFVGLLKGCLPFMSDLLKHVSIYCNLDYLRVSSYVNDQSTGTIKVLGELPNVKNRDVILVDDICDTGDTALAWKRKGYKIATHYYKKDALVQPDFWLKTKDDKWIVFPWEKQD